jgi:anti-sigma factor RsiW
VQCPDETRLQAHFDGELDAVATAELEHHLEGCPSCRAHLHGLAQLRTALRQDLPLVQAPDALRTQILRTLDRESGPTAPELKHRSRAAFSTRNFWLGAVSGLGAAAAAATLAFFFLAPSSSSSFEKELLSAHVSSLMSSHLVDVVSTDQHTVKPWFAGHTDVSPLVADFALQGYKLLGGRVDYVAQQRAAVVIYQHGPHVINVFSWAADSRALPANVTRNGYHMAFWKSGDLDYCAVSDTAWSELLGLTGLLKDLGAHDGQ